MVVLAFLKLLGCLGLLMYGTKLMGESLQKLAGDRLKHILDSLTTNRFTALLTGALVTAMIQSSTAASLMTISFVHAGMLSLFQALPVLMGASVGNTLIAWLMAAEINFEVSTYLYPLMLVAFLLVYYRRWRDWGESVFGLCFILLSLGLLCHFSADIAPEQQAEILNLLTVSNENYLSYIVLLLIGATVTFTVQSSAAIMASSMLFCCSGVWSIYSGVAFVLGENLGRAIVTMRAASSTGLQARRTAFGQSVFNLCGVAWMFLVFPYFVNLLCEIVNVDPTVKRTVADNSLAYVLAAFHTGFNLINATLFIGFVKPLETLCEKMVSKSQRHNEEEGELRFINRGLPETPEEAVLEARKEIINYADVTARMFTQTRILFSVAKHTEFKNILTLVEHYEDICDEMEVDIADYLNKISSQQPDRKLKTVVCGMLREVAEVESIGDCCLHIAHTAQRNYRSSQQLTDKQLEHIHQMFQLTEQALDQMKTLLSIRKTLRDASTTYYIENEINRFRKQLRNLNFLDVHNHVYSYQTGTMYMDIINECERLADCIINITEARLEVNKA